MVLGKKTINNQDFSIEHNKEKIQKRRDHILSLPGLVPLNLKDFQLLQIDTHIQFDVKKLDMQYLIEKQDIKEKLDAILIITYKKCYPLSKMYLIIQSVKEMLHYNINMIIGNYIDEKLKFPKLDIFL